MKSEKKKRIAVIGDQEFTLGFELAGVQKSYGKENYRENLEELLSSEEVGIVVADKRDLDSLPEKLRRKAEESVDPVVVSLSEDTGISGLQEKIQNVIGIDIS